MTHYHEGDFLCGGLITLILALVPAAMVYRGCVVNATDDGIQIEQGTCGCGVPSVVPQDQSGLRWDLEACLQKLSDCNAQPQQAQPQQAPDHRRTQTISKNCESVTTITEETN